MKIPFIAAACAIVLASCSSTPTQYYQLPDSAFRLPETAARSTGIQVVLADPLNSSSMLYQSGEYTVQPSQQNLWASPPDQMIAAALANKLNRLGAGSYQPAAGSSGLTVYIDRFQGSYTGDTEISGYARWQDGRSRNFSARTPQQGNGYEAMIRSLNSGLDSVAAQIAR